MIAATKKPGPSSEAKAEPKRKSLSVLDQLKQTANEKHKAVSRGLRTTLNAAREAGKALAQIKKQVGHGNWKDLFEREDKAFDFTIQTARKYVKIFENWDLCKLGDKDIGIEKACKVIKNFKDDDGSEEQPDLNGDGKKKADKKPKKKVSTVTVEFEPGLYKTLVEIAGEPEKVKDLVTALVEEAIAARGSKI